MYLDANEAVAGAFALLLFSLSVSFLTLEKLTMTKFKTVLCCPVRTAIGTYGGSLKNIAAPDLGAAVILKTLKRSGFAADKVQPW